MTVVDALRNLPETERPRLTLREIVREGFAILSRDEIQIFVQQQAGYVAPDDPGRRERHAWNVYIITDDVKALYEEYSALPGVKISRQLCRQDYGMMEFDVMDLNGHRLVFAQPSPAE